MKILRISAKCSDMFHASLIEDGRTIREHDGYVPDWFPNPQAGHYGDYVEMDIDIETGKIINWKRPTDKQLKELSENA